MERDSIATEIRALASAVGLAGFEAESPQPEILASLREMGLIAEGVEGAAATSPPEAPVAEAVSDKAVRSIGARLTSFLTTVLHQPAGKPFAEHLRSSAKQLLGDLRAPPRRAGR